jgi:long-chain acyl-CoA synthetase
MLSEWSKKCLDARVKKDETLADVLAPAMALAPDKVAIIYEDRTLTYREIDSTANRIANGLIGIGIKPGDRVAAHIDNRPEFILIYLGVVRAGGVLVPTNVMYTAEEMEHILTDSGARAIFVLSPLTEKIKKVNSPALVTLIELGDKTLGHTTLAEIIAKCAATRPNVKRDPSKVAIIQYTSGTTGKPKGAMVSDNNIFAVLDATSDLPGSLPGIPEDSTVVVLPLFHAYALDLVINRSFHTVQTMVLHNRFDAEKVFRDIEKYKITMFYGAPPMYHAFVNTPGLEKYNAKSLRGAFSGAAPLPVVVMEQFKALTGVQINEGYGLSETAPTLTSNMAGPVTKPGAVGPPIKNVEIRLVDDNDVEVGKGQVGEVIARGPNIFLGYWNRPEATEEAFRGGWFHTGDMGRFDEDGYLYIVDRKKDMVVVSGYNVYPIELENVIMRHPKIVDCAVIGVPNEYQGESVKACVVLKPGQTMTVEELQAYCREHLAAFKVPKFISIRTTLPKNPTGKILKRVLREEEGGITKAKT